MNHKGHRNIAAKPATELQRDGPLVAAMLRIAKLKGTEFNAENVKKIIEEVEARAKMH